MSEKTIIEKKASFWRIFWATLTATIVVSILGWVITLFVLGGLLSEEPDTDDKTVLHLTLSGAIAESSSTTIKSASLSIDRKTGLSDLLYGFELAANDDDVKGVFLDLKNVSCGYSTANEIRTAIHEFKKSGKFVIAYLSGEVVTQKQYFISSSANEVYGFPTTAMEFMGLGSENMYLKGLFDKVGLEMQVIRGSNNDFKSAVEPYFRSNMSDSGRVQVERYLGSIWSHVRSEIAKDRKISATELNDIAENTKIQRVEDALKFNMIDGVKYRDEVIDLIEKKAGNSVDMDKLMPFEKYAKTNFKDEQLGMSKNKAKPNIAVVLAEGAISVDGEEMTSKNICKYFQEIRQEKSIKTVVFRINSPGGSALASEEIWREVSLTAKTKTVIVSMGDVAASGGYYIATPAATIFAEPTTITGSIGVFGVIPYTGKVFEDNLGITFDRAQTNQHAVLSANRKLTESEVQLVQQEVDQIYTQFKSRVATGRGMPTKQVEVLARGRVWTGSDALERGLVDKLGGLTDAIAYAKKQAKISDASIKYWPVAKEDQLENILEQFGEKSRIKMDNSTKISARMLKTLRELEQLESLTGIQMRLPFGVDIQ